MVISTRKTFLQGLGFGAVSAFAAPSVWAKMRKPVFRAGLLTDTHIHDKPQTCAHVGKAMELFAREKVDVICHLGDLANEFAPAGFAEYRACIDRAFGRKPPLTLYAFGGHDRNGYKLQPGEKSREEAVFAIMREKMKFAHELIDTVEFRGYSFVIVQEYFSAWRKEVEERVDKAVAAHPGRPVFVLEHEPAWNTTCDSVVWGNRRMREICERHPEVIHLSGHNHGALRDERSIWQGAFTEINLGCMNAWSGEEANVCTRRDDWVSKPGQDVCVMEVYPDEVVFRRFSLFDGAECRPLDPWTIPVPHVPAKAPYAPVARKARSKAPVWPKGAAVTAIWQDAGKFRGFAVSVPNARHREDPFRYTAELFAQEKGKWTRVTVKERMGEFWKLPESARSAAVLFEFPDGYFLSNGKYRFVIRPMDFYGNFGKPLSAEVTAPAFEPAAERVWSAADPMSCCSFSTHSWGSDRKPCAVGTDGFVDLARDMASIDLPAEATIAADVPVGTDFRLSYTLDDRHADNTGWLVQNENAESGKRLGFRYIQSVQGSAGPVRYVTYLTKKESGPLPVRIGLMYGDRGARLRLSDIVLERLK